MPKLVTVRQVPGEGSEKCKRSRNTVDGDAVAYLAVIEDRAGASDRQRPPLTAVGSGIELGSGNDFPKRFDESSKHGEVDRLLGIPLYPRD